MVWILITFGANRPQKFCWNGEPDQTKVKEIPKITLLIDLHHLAQQGMQISSDFLGNPILTLKGICGVHEL